MGKTIKWNQKMPEGVKGPSVRCKVKVPILPDCDGRINRVWQTKHLRKKETILRRNHKEELLQNIWQRHHAISPVISDWTYLIILFFRACLLLSFRGNILKRRREKSQRWNENILLMFRMLCLNFSSLSRSLALFHVTKGKEQIKIKWRGKNRRQTITTANTVTRSSSRCDEKHSYENHLSSLWLRFYYIFVVVYCAAVACHRLCDVQTHTHTALTRLCWARVRAKSHFGPLNVEHSVFVSLHTLRLCRRRLGWFAHGWAAHTGIYFSFYFEWIFLSSSPLVRRLHISCA